MTDRSVLMIIADDWSPIAGCYGDAVVHTPHIDELAHTAAVFDRAFCTSPSCAASRASILTGQHSHTHLQFGHSHGWHHFRTKENLPTVPAVLGRAGVRAHLIGKDHTAPAATYPWTTNARPRTPTAAGFGEAVAEVFAEPGPTFVMVAPSYPHREADPSGFGVTQHTDGFQDRIPPLERVPIPGFLPDLPEVRQDLAYYYAAIHRFDQCVGAALDALRASGRLEQTLVLVTTDHGMPFPGAKASCYDSGHHCPLIIRDPRQALPRRSRALVNWLDLAPTIYDWLGVTPPSDPPLIGRSLVPILDAVDPSGWDEVVFSHSFHEVTMYDPYRVLRGRRYKFVQQLAYPMPMPMAIDLFESPSWQAVRRTGTRQLGARTIEQYERRQPEALYDVEVDPMETRNLIDQPGLAGVVADMRRRLVRHRFQTYDPWLMLDYQQGAVSEKPGH